MRAAAAEEAHQKAQLDVACLKRGLELAAEQLTRSTGAEVPSTLLRAVARVRWEGGLALGVECCSVPACIHAGCAACRLRAACTWLERLPS